MTANRWIHGRRDSVVGLAVTDAAVGTLHRAWYVERDARSGKLLRNVGLAILRGSVRRTGRAAVAGAW